MVVPQPCGKAVGVSEGVLVALQADGLEAAAAAHTQRLARLRTVQQLAGRQHFMVSTEGKMMNE